MSNKLIPSKGMSRSMYICCSNDGKYVYQATLDVIHGSNDYGKNFKRFSTESNEWSSISCDSSGANVAATTWSGKLYLSLDYGNNWINSKVMQYGGGTYITPNRAFLYYYGPGGLIFKASGVQNKDSTLIFNTNDFFQFWPRCKIASSETGNILYITGGGHGKKCYMSKNSGNSWQEINLEASVYQGVACSSDGSIAYFVSDNSKGQVFQSTDTGSTWNNIYNAGKRLQDVCCSADGNKVIISGEIINYSFDSGKSWKNNIQYDKGPFYNSICCSKDGSNVYISANQGGIFYLESTNLITT